MSDSENTMSESEDKHGKLRTPVRFADYKGIVDASLGSLRGPNTLGEYMAVVEVRHNFQDQTTRVGYAFAGSGDPRLYMDRFANSHRVLSEAVINNGAS